MQPELRFRFRLQERRPGHLRLLQGLPQERRPERLQRPEQLRGPKDRHERHQLQVQLPERGSLELPEEPQARSQRPEPEPGVPDTSSSSFLREFRIDCRWQVGYGSCRTIGSSE